MRPLVAAEEKMSQLAGNLDRAADEVFSTMMGVGCEPIVGAENPERGTLSAVIGLAGALSGSLILHSGAGAARRMAGRLTGSEPDEVDALVRDAVGEVANMLAGAWKGFDPELSSGCLLSTPTVVAGSSYQLFSQRAAMRLERSYRFEEMSFTVTVFCEWPS